MIPGGKDLQKNKAAKFDQIKITLKYKENGQPKISSLKELVNLVVEFMLIKMKLSQF